MAQHSSETASPHNVPVLRRPLIGREAAQDALLVLLRRDDIGLVTLIGPGGVGKTRLSLQIAARAMSYFTDGIWFVPLADCAAPEFVLPTIAKALGVQEGGEQALLAVVQAFLAARHALLILDNWEHVLRASGLVAELLAGAPGLVVLATSRIPLRLIGEQEYPLLPLPLPDAGQDTDLAVLATVPAVALFWNGRGRCSQASPLPRPTPRSSPRSARGWMACRWRSNWRRRWPLRVVATWWRRGSTARRSASARYLVRRSPPIQPMRLRYSTISPLRAGDSMPPPGRQRGPRVGN